MINGHAFHEYALLLGVNPDLVSRIEEENRESLISCDWAATITQLVSFAHEFGMEGRGVLSVVAAHLISAIDDPSLHELRRGSTTDSIVALAHLTYGHLEMVINTPQYGPSLVAVEPYFKDFSKQTHFPDLLLALQPLVSPTRG